MNIRDYEYIIRIAEQQSISRAADLLFVSQSALTKYLQRTEKLIGLKIFDRKGHRFLLTEAGRQYVETGRKIIALDRQLMMDLNNELTRRKQQIRLGFGIGRSSAVLDHVLPAFYRIHPDIDISATMGSSVELFHALERGNLDLVLVVGGDHLPDFTYIPVTPSYPVLVIPEDDPMINAAENQKGFPHPVISIRYLTGASMVLTVPTTRSGILARQILEQYDISCRIKLEVGDTRTLLDAVQSRLGYGIVLSVPLGKRRLHFLSIQECKIMQTMVFLVYKKDMTVTPAMHDMIELLRSIR